MDENEIYESLEEADTSLDSSSSEPTDVIDPITKSGSGNQKPRISKRLMIIGLLTTVILLAIVGLIIAVVFKSPPKPSTTITINTQSLSNGTLTKLQKQAGSEPAKEQLTITPDTLFKNDVEVQGNSKLDKSLVVEGTATIQGATSLGNSLSVHGNLSVGGSTNLSGNLSVSGLLTVASLSVGSLTTNTIKLNGDLNLAGHIVPTGSVPTIIPSVAASGGITSIDGTDTSGTVNIQVGNGATLAGEMAIITFHTAYNLTPRVELTPANSDAASLEYFVTQSPTFFTVRSGSIPKAGTIYTFNYFVTQ